MIISHVLSAFLSLVHSGIKNQGFPIFDEIVYAPDLIWDEEPRKVCVSNDFQLKIETDQNNWLIMIWNREALKVSDTQARKFVPIRNSDGKTLHARYGDLNVSLAFICTSIYMLEGVEEYLLTNDYRINYFVNVPNLGDIGVAVKDWNVGSLVKDDLTNYGSVVTLTITATIGFPVAVPDPGTVSLIYYPCLDIYIEDGGGVMKIPKSYTGKTDLNFIVESEYEKG